MSTRHYGDFEWDTTKAARNLREHGVSFEEAATAFADPFGIDAPDMYIPDRFVLIGRSTRSRILFVVHAERGPSIRAHQREESLADPEEKV